MSFFSLVLLFMIRLAPEGEGLVEGADRIGRAAASCMSMGESEKRIGCVRELWVSRFDCRAIADEALGEHPEVKGGTREMIQDLLCDAIWARLCKTISTVMITNPSFRIAGKRAISGKTGEVSSIVEYTKQNLSRVSKIVEIRLKKVGSKWKVGDLTIGDETLGLNYRGMFNKLIRTRGIDGLASALENFIKNSPPECRI